MKSSYEKQWEARTLTNHLAAGGVHGQKRALDLDRLTPLDCMVEANLALVVGQIWPFFARASETALSRAHRSAG